MPCAVQANLAGQDLDDAEVFLQQYLDRLIKRQKAFEVRADMVTDTVGQTLRYFSAAALTDQEMEAALHALVAKLWPLWRAQLMETDSDPMTLLFLVHNRLGMCFIPTLEETCVTIRVVPSTLCNQFVVKLPRSVDHISTFML